MKNLANASNNKEVYLCLMKAHLKRAWSQNMSEWLEEAGGELGTAASDELFMQSKHHRNTHETYLRYPILESATHQAISHLRLKVRAKLKYFVCF